MQRYENLTVDEFRQCEPEDPHRHQILLSESCEPGGFTGIAPDTETLWTDESWSFAISDGKGNPERGWRVHGFIYQGVFHVVWLDPDHKLYLDKGRTTPKRPVRKGRKS
jgi:hypothetical protein